MKLLARRSYQLSLLLLAVFSLVCTQIPLFNYLGFEFSALLSVVAGYLAGLLVIEEWRKSDGSAVPMRFFARVGGESLLMLVLPLAIMLLNAFLVKNCSILQGLILFLLLPVPAVLFSGSVAFACATLFKRFQKTWFTLSEIGVLGHIAFVTFGKPQIFAFNPIIGFFPGISYDESLDILGKLGLYRLTTVLLAYLVVLLSGVLLRWKSRPRSEFVWKKSELWASTVGLLLLFTSFFFSNELGFSSSESFIEQNLGGKLETEHFVIVYPADEISMERAEKLAMLHEFYFRSIARELRVTPLRKIRSFLYASPEQKGRLIGAAGTNISKPWLWQLHVNVKDVDAVLKHEMVHVVAAEFGFPLLRIGLNSGLIEGLATAVERVEYDETLDALAAQIYGSGLHPDVSALFSFTGFLKGHGGTSYVVAGSFCRYLIDQYGIRRFKWLYRTGSFESFYNKSLETLIAEWQRHIARYEPTRQQSMKGAYLFRRPSIFGKECARVIANLNSETRDLMSRKKFAEAAQKSEQTLALTNSPDAILQRAGALLGLNRYQETIEFCFDKLRDSTVAHVLLPLYSTLGDSYWGMNLYPEAQQMYETLYSVHLSYGWDESLGIRMEALQNKGEAETLKEFFLTAKGDSARIVWLDSLIERRSHSVLAHYLLGREYMRNGRYPEAIKVLLPIGAMHSGILEFARHRMLARAYFETGEFQKAKVYFWESLNFTTKTAHQIQTEEWLTRCDWMEQTGG